MSSNNFQANLDTTINPSNNYISNALKPTISPGDKCNKIIPIGFKDSILTANTTSSSGKYNKKLITKRTERPYVWKQPNPSSTLKTKSYRACTRWCASMKFGVIPWYKCCSYGKKYYTYRHYFPWTKGPNNPRYFCKYNNTNELTSLGNNLGRELAIKKSLEQKFKYTVKDTQNNWYGTNSTNLFTTSNKYNSSECLGNSVYLTDIYEISDKIATDCANMVNKINQASTLNQDTSSLENALDYYVKRANSRLSTERTDNSLESFETMSSSELQDSKDVTSNVVSNLNSQIKTLTKEFDIRARIANNQRAILRKNYLRDDVMDMKREKNLNKLQSIADEVMVKDRLVEFNNKKLEDSNITVKLLRGFFATFILMVIPIVMYFSGAFSLKVLAIIIILYLVGYFIYMGVMFRKRKMKSFFKPMFKDISNYEKEVRKYVKKEENKISKELSEFVYGNCNCPEEEEEGSSGGGGNVPITEEDTYYVDNNDGYYYNDGTAPSQRLIPAVDNVHGDPPRYSIDWETNKQMGVTDSSTGTAPPNWYNIGLPIISDTMQKIINKCQKYNEINVQLTNDEFIKGAYFLVNGNDISSTELTNIKLRYQNTMNLNEKKVIFQEMLDNARITKEQFLKNLYNRGTNPKDKQRSNTLISLYVSLLNESSSTSTLTVGL